MREKKKSADRNAYDKSLKQNEKQAKRGRKSKKELEAKRNKEFKRVFWIFAGLFLLLVGYLIYFLTVESENIINNPYNTRIDLLAKKVSRGTIYGRNGEVLAETITDEEGKEIRYYPFGSLFVHTVGYNTHGKSGIEYSMNYELLTSNTGFFKKLANDFKGEKDEGNSVHTTLDAGLQKAAYDALGDYKGAVVVIEPTTGKLLAMVSKPDFDPNNISQLWETLVNQKGTEENGTVDEASRAAMLNRATQGLYEPGSVFKIITTLAYIREYPDTWRDFVYDCSSGVYKNSGAKISCYHGKAHGKNSLEKAFALSCNGAFASVGNMLDCKRLTDTCNSLGMNVVLNGSVASLANRFSLEEEAPEWEYLQTMIGQGQTAITPYYGAILASAVANGGIAMTPYMIDYVAAPDGDIIAEYSPQMYGVWMTEAEAEILGELMHGCVTGGTAYSLNSIEAECYGKTGTAETQAEKPNAWFVGYAATDGKADIAISVIVEESGAGSEYAVPVAKAVFEAYYEAVK